MALELSWVNFTDQNDIVPMSGVESILNYSNTYTLAGNDIITGTYSYYDPDTRLIGLLNHYGTIDTGSGNDSIIGQALGTWYGSYDLYTTYGIYNNDSASIETGHGKDYVTSYGTFFNSGVVSLGESNDSLFAEVHAEAANSSSALENYQTIDAGNGDDYLGIFGTFYNSGMVSLGDGNDSITANVYNTYGYGRVLENYQTIDAGNGDDIISSNGFIYNRGIINTGSGKDSITAYGFGGDGNVFLGNGEDYLSGFGSGYYEGGNDQDSLQLTSGTYTIGISGAEVSFIKNGDIMRTSGFEQLIAGSQTYNFTSLTEELTIYV